MEIVFENVKCIKNDNLIFDDLNLTIYNNHITGIIGPMGAGKSTILEMISTFTMPTDGKIMIGDLIFGENIKKRDAQKLLRNVAILFQSSYDQIYNLTVKKELMLSLSDLKLTKKERLTRISNVLALVELDDSYLDKNPFDLSQTELRKVAIASTIIRMPDVLLLDDPTIGLDLNNKKMIVNLLKRLKRECGMTIVVASNDVDFLNQIAEDIVVLKMGKVILSGEKKKVFKEEKFLSDNGINTPKIVSFENLVLSSKGIKIGYRDDINDLIKDIFRYAK